MMHGIGIYKWQALFYFMLFYFILQVTAHNAIPFIFVLYVLCEVSCSFGSTCSLENFTSERELVSHKYFLLWVEKGANLQRAARWSVSGVTWKKKKTNKKSHSHTSFVTEQWLPVVLFSHIKISVKLPRLNYNQHSRHSRWELVGRSEFTTLFEHIPMAQPECHHSEMVRRRNVMYKSQPNLWHPSPPIFFTMSVFAISRFQENLYLSVRYCVQSLSR